MKLLSGESDFQPAALESMQMDNPNQSVLRVPSGSSERPQDMVWKDATCSTCLRCLLLPSAEGLTPRKQHPQGLLRGRNRGG